MAKLSYASQALQDIESLTSFLAESDPAVALETAQLIEEAVLILGRHPLIGRPIEHGLRELIISRGRTGYVALYLYRENEDVALILAIRHQREAGYWRAQF